MDEPRLFPLPVAAPLTEPKTESARPRVERPNRIQVEWWPLALDQLLPAEHRARLAWRFVEGLDLGARYARIEAVEGVPGRPAIDPQILVALWLYATLEGVGSARALDRLCTEHVADQWLCGGVSVNYHTLADARVQYGEVLDDLLTQSVAVLLHEGLVDLAVVTQDGYKVRARAGASSFHRRRTLQRCLKEARRHVARLRKEVAADPSALSRRHQAARERAAREREQRAQAALPHLRELGRAKQEQRSGTGSHFSPRFSRLTVIQKLNCACTNPSERLAYWAAVTGPW